MAFQKSHTLDSILDATDGIEDINDIAVAAVLGRQTMHGRTFKESAEPNHVYYLQDPQGVKKVHADAPPLALTFATPASLAKFVTDDAKADQEIETDNGSKYITGLAISPAIFIGKKVIRYVRDVNDRRNHADVGLDLSEPFKALQFAGVGDEGDGVDQKQLLRMLRVQLAGYIQNPDFAATIETVKFVDHKDGENTVGHGRESLSLSVEAELRGTGNIPDTVSFSLPLFEQTGEKNVLIRCAVEIDPVEKTFAITPLPGELTKAYDETFQAIEEDLEAAGVPIYHGSV
ncbi:MAG: hypothetical protein AAGD32_17415 [Planctomycetota bacterium]